MADTYLLPCPNCDESIPVTTRLAGQDYPCQACKKMISVPRLGTLKQLPRQGMSESDDLPRSARSKKPNQLAGALFSMGLIALTLCGVGGYFAYSRAISLIDTRDVEAEVRTENEQIDKFRAFEIWDSWQAIETSGLGEYQKTDFVKQNEEGAIMKYVAYSLFGVAGIGLIMMLGSLLFRQEK